jgi:hypothetical protein
MYAPDGSSVSGVVVGEGMDSGDKAGNKALAIGHKYFYFQLFSIPTAEMVDPDAESHEITPKEPQKRMSAGKKDFIFAMADMLKFIGPDKYREVLDKHGVKESGDVTDRTIQLQIYADMQKIKDEGSEIKW